MVTFVFRHILKIGYLTDSKHSVVDLASETRDDEETRGSPIYQNQVFDGTSENMAEVQYENINAGEIRINEQEQEDDYLTLRI